FIFFPYTTLFRSLFNFPAQEKGPDKLSRLMDYINYNYVDEVDTDSIVNAVIVDVLGQLDPHSTYIPERHYPEVAQRMNGSFVGIGIQFFRIKDTIAVI